MTNPPDSNLATRCQAYLDAGPPAQMTDYVSGSLTEIIIAHGAKNRELDSELREIGDMVLLESQNFDSHKDAGIRDYMKRGAELVSEVLARPPGRLQ
jgi:hypothetical protein